MSETPEEETKQCEHLRTGDMQEFDPGDGDILVSWPCLDCGMSIGPDEKEKSDLRAQLAEAQEKKEGYQHHCRECEQIAGKALGYPWFKDDPKNFPDATEEDGVCIGEHVADSIVAELATKYAEAHGKLKAAEQDIKSHKVNFQTAQNNARIASHNEAVANQRAEAAEDDVAALREGLIHLVSTLPQNAILDAQEIWGVTNAMVVERAIGKANELLSRDHPGADVKAMREALEAAQDQICNRGSWDHDELMKLINSALGD